MKREVLTLRKPPDPQKIALSLEIGFRFVDRKGRYILQRAKMVSYDSHDGHTWVDIPLVPETYGEAQA
jgi:hypothetical protein